jgi:hypothetical protein
MRRRHFISLIGGDGPEIRAAIGAFDGEQGSGLIVLPDPIFGTYRSSIFELVAKQHHPTIYPFRNFTEAGGFNILDQVRRSAFYVDHIFEGSATRRSAGTSADQIRVSHQFKDGQGAGSGCSPDTARPRRRSDRISPPTSGIGMFETCRRVLRMSGVGGRPEVISRCSKRRF